jgi:hypothetical protein
MDPTPHAKMPNRLNNLENTTFTNVGFDVSFIIMHHSTSDPTHVRHIHMEQLPFAYCVKPLKKNCLRLVHLLMHGLNNTTPSCQIDGHLSFPGIVGKPCFWCK